MKTITTLITALFLTFASPVFAQEFFSTETPQQLFNIGFRLGVNTSNRTFPKGAFNRWNTNGWGTGVEAGCVVDINIRDFISIQPGFFAGTRSDTYAYAHSYYDVYGEKDDFSQMGRNRAFSFTIPIMASFRFNLSPSVRLIAEAGPYVEYFLSNTAKEKIIVLNRQTSIDDLVEGTTAHPSKGDYGFKIGAGISFRRHYSFHIHYLAGCRHAWSTPLTGGHNKQWLFTVGYDL